MPGFQSTRLVTEGALEPFFFLYTDDSIQGNPETCKQSSIMLNYEVKNSELFWEKKNIRKLIADAFSAKRAVVDRLHDNVGCNAACRLAVSNHK